MDSQPQREIEGRSGNEEILIEIEGSRGNEEIHRVIESSSGNEEIHSKIEGSKGNEKSNERSPKREEEYHSKLYKAAIHGDWKTAERIINDNPDALTALIGPESEPALHVAVKAGHSMLFVQKLVNLMPPALLETTDSDGATALHYAAYAGNTKAVQILVEKNSILPQQMNPSGYSALHIAALYGYKETVSYLLSVTRDVERSPFAAQNGVWLLNLLIFADFYDIALYLLKRYPKLALESYKYEPTSLEILAGKPHAFESGSRLGRGQRLIYHCCFCFLRIMNLYQSPEEYLKASKRYRFIQHIQNTMLTHTEAMELLGILINAADSGNLIAAHMFEAAELGITEIVVEAIN